MDCRGSINISPIPDSPRTTCSGLGTGENLYKEYLKAASDELLVFKPTPEMRSYTEQMLHLAEDNYLFAAIAIGEKPRFVYRELETKRVTSLGSLGENRNGEL